MVAGIDVWETEWHSLAEEITVVDPIHGDSIVLTIGWIAAGQRLLRVAATEVSAGVYAFAEFRGEPPDCARCLELRGDYELRMPSDLAKALRIAKAYVANGTLVGGVGADMALSEIASDGPWPDVLDLRFMCTGCGALFERDAETYHGRGGRWHVLDERTA